MGHPVYLNEVHSEHKLRIFVLDGEQGREFWLDQFHKTPEMYMQNKLLKDFLKFVEKNMPNLKDLKVAQGFW